MERVVSGFSRGDIVATLRTLRPFSPGGAHIPANTQGTVTDSDGFMVGVQFPGRKVLYVRASWLWLVQYGG